MRYLLRNTVRDPETLALRAQNVAKVQLRPMIAGTPLPPGSSRLFRLNEFTVSLLAEIDRFSAIGNVRLYCVGRSGGAASTDDIRRLLRLPTAASPVDSSGPVSSPPVQVAPETSAEVVVPVVPVVEEPVVVAAPIELRADPVVEVPVVETVEISVAEEPTAAETPVADTTRREELEAMKLTELRDLLTSLGGKSGGKNKPVLVDEILELEQA